ncbi:sterol desaturase family protein [Dyadobacter tibetensis]|uniref:sterol desaturase family protein n=1 Tax=Dyadobacter tibetensis TaxID=1211851 RepID=UPI0004701267|nr:sterol desaturase family protein [Dyadobacter tibetensis]
MLEIIHYAVPVFVLALLVEVLYFKYIQHDASHYKWRDTVASLSMGIGNVITGIFSKGILLASLYLVYQYQFWELDRSLWWYWILIFFADDFSYYWFHRSSHQIRYFWASHVVHHSSQFYNLGTALRQTWTGQISGSFIFYLWMPLIGFHPVDVLLMQTLSLIYQFFIHTESVNRLPAWIEYIFNTPAHHRVHHGSDLKYLDKNHAGILIIWDRIFGTFQQEEERPVYGLTNNLKSYYPFNIAFHEWKAIYHDLLAANNFRSVIGYLFGPPGWSHDGSRSTTQQLRSKGQGSPQAVSEAPSVTNDITEKGPHTH